jgi:hypothetical protein
MFKVMEVMASLNKDTMAKACRKTFNRIEGLLDDEGTFIGKNVRYVPYGTFPESFAEIGSKNDIFIAFRVETLPMWRRI